MTTVRPHSKAAQILAMVDTSALTTKDVALILGTDPNTAGGILRKLGLPYVKQSTRPTPRPPAQWGFPVRLPGDPERNWKRLLDGRRFDGRAA
jgi:hypothetical protein